MQILLQTLSEAEKPRRRVTAVMVTLALVWLLCEAWRYGILEPVIRYGISFIKVGGGG